MRRPKCFWPRANRPEPLIPLDAGNLADALRTYATRVTTRGEQGVLATINTKAVVAWLTLRNQCLAALGKKEKRSPPPNGNPCLEILLPRFIGSAPRGHDLKLMPISMGGRPAWLHYRQLGQAAWKTRPVGSGQRLGMPRRYSVGRYAGTRHRDQLLLRHVACGAMASGPMLLTIMPAKPADAAPLAKVAPPDLIDLDDHLQVAWQSALRASPGTQRPKPISSRSIETAYCWLRRPCRSSPKCLISR